MEAQLRVSSPPHALASHSFGAKHSGPIPAIPRAGSIDVFDHCIIVSLGDKCRSRAIITNTVSFPAQDGGDSCVGVVPRHRYWRNSRCGRQPALGSAAASAFRPRLHSTTGLKAWAASAS